MMHPRGLALLAVASLLALAACLPASVRPTPTPSPALPTPAPLPTPTPTPGPPTPTPAPTFAMYTVKRGDNLLGIAKRFRTTGRSIAYWNRDAYPSLDPESPKYNPNRLDIGWVLRILPGKVQDSPPGATPTPPEGEPPDESLGAGPGASPTDGG